METQPCLTQRKLWVMPCRATQGGCVMVESSDKMWFTGEGKDKPLQHSCLENPMNSMKRQKGMTLKDELPRSVGAQYATGEEQRNNSKRNEEAEPKQKWCPVVDDPGGERKAKAVNNNILWEPGMLDPLIKVKRKRSNRRFQEWILTC